MPENHTSDDVGGVSAFAACVVETVGVGQSELAIRGMAASRDDARSREPTRIEVVVHDDDEPHTRSHSASARSKRAMLAAQKGLSKSLHQLEHVVDQPWEQTARHLLKSDRLIAALDALIVGFDPQHVERFVSLVHGGMEISPCRLKEETVTALFGGASTLGNVRLGKTFVTLPSHLISGILRGHVTESLRIHIQHAEVDLLPLPNLLAPTRVREIQQRLFGKVADEAQKMDRAYASATKRDKKRPAPVTRVARDSRAMRVLEGLQSATFLACLVLLVLGECVWEVEANLISKSHYSDNKDPAAAGAQAFGLFAYEMAMNMVFVLELALRASLYARCYVAGLREFIASPAHCVDALVTAQNLMRLLVEAIAVLDESAISHGTLYAWRFLRVLTFVRLVRLGGKTFKAAVKNLRGYNHIIKVVDGFVVDLDACTANQLKSSGTFVEEYLRLMARAARGSHTLFMDYTKHAASTAGSRTVIELRNLRVRNTDARFESDDVVSLDHFTSACELEGTGEAAVTAHKHVSFTASMTEVNEHAMHLPRLEPVLIHLKLALTRRLSDAAVADVALQIELPPSVALLVPALPISMRVHVDIVQSAARATGELSDGSPRHRRGHDRRHSHVVQSDEATREWFARSTQAAHAAAMWRLLRDWLGAGDMKRWSAFFDELDADGSGELSYDEFGTLLRRHGIRLEENDMQSLMEGVDASGDGSIDRDEFEAWIKGAAGTLGGQIKGDAESGAASGRAGGADAGVGLEASSPIATGLMPDRSVAERGDRGRASLALSQTFRDTGSGLMLAAARPYLELLIDGYDHERTISDPSLLHVHFTDEGFVLRPTRLRHSTVTALMGGKNKYANLSLGACEVTLPSFYDLLSERPMSDGDDRPPVTVHLESFEADLMPFTRIMAADDVDHIRSQLFGLKPLRAREQESGGGDGGGGASVRGAEDHDADDAAIAAIYDFAPRVSRETGATAPDTMCGMSGCASSDEDAGPFTSVGFGDAGADDAAAAAIALADSKAGVDTALDAIQRKKKAYGLKRRLLDSVVLKVDRVRLNKLAPTAAMRSELEHAETASPRSPGQRPSLGSKRASYTKAESAAHDDGPRTVLDLRELVVCNATRDWHHAADHTGDGHTEVGMDACAEDALVPDTDEPAAVAHKRVVVRAVEVFAVDEHGMRTPLIRPFPLDVRVALTRRCVDSSPSDLGVKLVLPSHFCLVKAGLPICARVRVACVTRELSCRTAHGTATWFARSAEAAHAASMWELVHHWLSDGEAHRWEALFDELDVDHSGELSYDELRALLAHHGIVLGPDDFARFCAAIDADGDGSITKQEFRESVMKLKAQAQQTSAPGAEEKEEI